MEVSELILPGVCDMHVHLRTPGQEHKEDFTSGTAAALAGGVVAVFDMPNNAEPVTTRERLERKMALAERMALSDIGFYFGSLGNNLEEFPKVASLVFGLKLYLNETTGSYLISGDGLVNIYRSWHEATPDRPIILHAEEDVLSEALAVVGKISHPTHIAHVSGKEELEIIMNAKNAGLPVTCGVCPHHLFLTKRDEKRLGAFGKMKPPLRSKEDQEFLWEHLDAIDVFETDHAPHTKIEKESDNPPFGVPGLETLLPLLLTAEKNGKITREQIIEKTATRPREVLGLPQNNDSRVFVRPQVYEISAEALHTKCGWSPLEGQEVFGRVVRVEQRGRCVYEDGQVIARPGEGNVITPPTQD